MKTVSAVWNVVVDRGRSVPCVASHIDCEFLELVRVACERQRSIQGVLLQGEGLVLAALHNTAFGVL